MIDKKSQTQWRFTHNCDVNNKFTFFIYFTLYIIIIITIMKPVFHSIPVGFPLLGRSLPHLPYPSRKPFRCFFSYNFIDKLQVFNLVGLATLAPLALHRRSGRYIIEHADWVNDGCPTSNKPFPSKLCHVLIIIK